MRSVIRPLNLLVVAASFAALVSEASAVRKCPDDYAQPWKDSCEGKGGGPANGGKFSCSFQGSGAGTSVAIGCIDKNGASIRLSPNTKGPAVLGEQASAGSVEAAFERPGKGGTCRSGWRLHTPSCPPNAKCIQVCRKEGRAEAASTPAKADLERSQGGRCRPGWELVRSHCPPNARCAPPMWCKKRGQSRCGPGRVYMLARCKRGSECMSGCVSPRRLHPRGPASDAK